MRQDLLVQLLRLLLHTLENVLSLFPAAHQDDTLDDIIVVLEAELPKPRRMTYGYFADVTDPNRSPIDAGNYNFADVFGVTHQTQPPNVIELPSLRIESASCVGIVGRQSLHHLGDGDVISVDAGRV